MEQENLEELIDAINRAFGSTENIRGIPYLEGIAMALGGDNLRHSVAEGLSEIALAIRYLADVIEERK